MTPLRRAALLGVLLIPSWGAAQDLSLGGAFATDPTAPVEVTSEALNVDQATGAATFTGNVVIGQGDLRLQAGEVEVRYDEATSAIARLLATGGVTLATPSEAAEVGRLVEAHAKTIEVVELHARLERLERLTSQ